MLPIAEEKSSPSPRQDSKDPAAGKDLTVDAWAEEEQESEGSFAEAGGELFSQSSAGRRAPPRSSWPSTEWTSARSSEVEHGAPSGAPRQTVGTTLELFEIL